MFGRRKTRRRPTAEPDEFASRFALALPPVEAPESIWGSIESGLEAPRRSLIPVRLVTAAVAGMLAILFALSWYHGRHLRGHWEVLSLNGAPAIGSQRIVRGGSISEGDWLQTDASSRAQIKIGEIGTVEVGPNTRVRLTAARPDEHRLRLARGDISATVSAPPRLFFVDTSASTAVDLGCAYTMHVDDSGDGLLKVTLGWVSLEWGGRKSLVPAGASCRTRPRIGPGTPYLDDASARLEQALANFDFGDRREPDVLDAILAESRAPDTLTLWHLLSRVEPKDRARVLDRMTVLVGLPAGMVRDKILNLDPESLSRLKDALALEW
jgi:hypothetical protein